MKFNVSNSIKMHNKLKPKHNDLKLVKHLKKIHELMQNYFSFHPNKLSRNALIYFRYFKELKIQSHLHIAVV